MHYNTSYAAATEDFSVYPDVVSSYEIKTRKQECQRKMGTSDETKWHSDMKCHSDKGTDWKMAHLAESLDCIPIQITRRNTLAVCIDMKYKPFKLIGIMSTAALTLVSLQPVNSSLLLELS